MTETLYTRVSPQFDSGDLKGLLVAGPELSDTYGFTELGYETANYTKPPTVLQVTVLTDKIADNMDVEAAAERAGIKLYMDIEQYLSEWPQATSEGFAERMYPALEQNCANQLLERPEVIKEIEAAGFEAFHGSIVITNYEVDVTCLWKTGTFSVSEPLPVVGMDSDHPYHVELADAAPSIAP